jgi:hypothetical protein
LLNYSPFFSTLKPLIKVLAALGVDGLLDLNITLPFFLIPVSIVDGVLIF